MDRCGALMLRPPLMAGCYRPARAVAVTSIAVMARSLSASRLDQARVQAGSSGVSPRLGEGAGRPLRRIVSTQVPDVSSRSQKGAPCVLSKVRLGITTVTSLTRAHARSAHLW